MLALSCCSNVCSDVNIVFGCGTRALYQHSATWDCNEYRRRRKDLQANGTAADPFYDYFRQLPYELKMMCLSRCGFHALVNTELWLRDIDSYHFKQIMRNYHVSGPPCRYCRADAIDLNTNPTDVYIDFGTGLRGENFSLLDTVDRDRRELDKMFGTVNRYPSFYYRRCQHFDHLRSRRDGGASKYSIPERWRRLLRSIESSAPIDAIAKTVYHRNKKLNFLYGDDNASFDGMVSLDVGMKTKIEAGIYYFEFVNYAWEEAVAAVDGEGSRQRHFFLDPTDVSHTSRARDGRKRVLKSLMFRRACHPNAEVEDRYTTMGYFRTQNVSADCSGKQFVEIYFVLDEKIHRDFKAFIDDPPIYRTTYVQSVYRHVLTPGSEISVFKCTNYSSGKVLFYRARFPANVKFHSIDRNAHTVRVNFYTWCADMNRHERSSFTTSLVKAVNTKLDRGYAFLGPSDISESFYRAEELFDLIYK